MRVPSPGSLYRLTRSARLIIPLERDPDRRYEYDCDVVWRCLTADGIETLWLWEGSYEHVEEGPLRAIRNKE